MFYKGKSACFIVFLASSAEEIVPTLPGVFLLWKRPCRHYVEHFFRGRNLAGVVGRISPREETQPTVSVDFRGIPKIYQPNTELEVDERAHVRSVDKFAVENKIILKFAHFIKR